MNATDEAAAIKLARELQRRGYRVVVQQDKGEVTVYLGRREAPVAEDVKATARTFTAALENAQQMAGTR